MLSFFILPTPNTLYLKNEQVCKKEEAQNYPLFLQPFEIRIVLIRLNNLKCFRAVYPIYLNYIRTGFQGSAY